ncbi:MAG: HAMP domain-containing histidine kinase [Actinomycetota bacterium]|nr:HAMP domain-containing histidine kinase [Actinomycetota bacterium]
MGTTLPIPVPGGFRRRLTVAFVLVAASAGGLLALTSYGLIREYRYQTFESHAEEGAKLSLLSTPGELTLSDFEALVVEFRRRGGFETVALVDGAVFSSLPELDVDDIPSDLDGPVERSELVRADTVVDGHPYLVIGGARGSGDARLYFFFSKDQLIASVTELRNVLVVGWLVAVVAAALVGRYVARRTLRPVRAAAEASQSLAEGLLDTRLTRLSDDEFGVLGHAFNEMADALQAKMEQLERTAERERRFTADVAHELRTPLAAMMSATALVEDGQGELPVDMRRPVQLLVNDVRRLQGLVLELLELARLDAGRESPDLEPLRLQDAVNAAVATCDPDGTIDVEVPGDVYVMADRARFRRVVTNLVDNAGRHGAPPITVEAGRQGDDVAIHVLDRGPGVGNDSERLFHRFYKADTARTRDGAGLGLAIALENAKLQNGALRAANREGGGACFTLVLGAAPAARQSSDEHHQTSSI